MCQILCAGQGRHTFLDGSYYEGSWVAGERGTGMFVSGDGAMEYRGQWRGVLRHGQGTLFQKDLFKYTGVRDREDIRMRCLASEQGTGMGFSGDRAMQSRKQWRGMLRHGQGTLFQKDLIRYTAASQLHEAEKTLTCMRWVASAAQGLFFERGQGNGIQGHRVLRHGHGMLFQKDPCKYTGAHHSIRRQRRHSHALPGKRAWYRHTCEPY